MSQPSARPRHRMTTCPKLVAGNKPAPARLAANPASARSTTEREPAKMKRSIDRILTTHVGSLIRPQPLQAFLRAKQGGEAFDGNGYAACLTEAVAAIVRR